MNNSLRILSFFCLTWFFFISAHSSGCKSKETISEGPPRPATEVRSSDFLVKKIKASQSELRKITSLTAKAKLFSENESMSISANASIVWIRDSVIWINVKKFGIEAVRALVTRDSVFVLNRLEKTFSAQSLNSLKNQYGLPNEAGFQMLEEVLLGQATLLNNVVLKSDIAQERHRLQGANSQSQVMYMVEEGSFLLKNESFLETGKNRSILMTFDRHEKIEGISVLFPYLRHLEAHTTESGKVNVDIDLSDVQFNTQPSYKFEIPSSYTKQ